VADNIEGNDEPLERHIFATGGDTNTAEAKLLGLLSDEDLEAKTLSEAGPEEGSPPVKGEAPVPDEGESEEEEVLEQEGESPLGEEEDEGDDGEADDEEYEYVDADGNVIEDPADSETYTVLVDGKEHEVTLEDLTQSYSFRAHNTQKSQELAAARQEADADAVAGRESREVYGQRLQSLEQALASIYPQEPDWDTLEVEDPTRFATESAKWTRHQQKMDALHAERKRVYDEQVTDQTQQLEEYKADQSKRMMEAIPEWSKPEVLKTEQAKVYSYAQDALGFSDDEINSIIDHRAVVAIRKAMLYDELKTKGRKVRKGQKSTGVLKPGTRRRRVKAGAKRTQAARRRLSESGSVRDASALLYDMLGDDA